MMITSTWKRDAIGRIGFFGLQKCTAASEETKMLTTKMDELDRSSFIDSEEKV